MGGKSGEDEQEIIKLNVQTKIGKVFFIWIVKNYYFTTNVEMDRGSATASTALLSIQST